MEIKGSELLLLLLHEQRICKTQGQHCQPSQLLLAWPRLVDFVSAQSFSDTFHFEKEVKKSGLIDKLFNSEVVGAR